MKQIDWKWVYFILITIILGVFLIIAIIKGEHYTSVFILGIEILNYLSTFQRDKLAKSLEELRKIGIGSQPKDISSNRHSVMVDQVEEYFNKKNYRAALRLGQCLSRTLWMDYRYSERIRLGKINLEASSVLQNKKSQALALIDDLGWTNVMLTNYRDALKYINEGFKIAEDIQDFYLIAKVKRHLGGIHIKRFEYPDAKRNLFEAEEIAKNISEEKSRKEMFGGIQYGLAELYLNMGETFDAELAVNKAIKIFEEINDIERLVTKYSRFGNIYLKKNMNQQALNFFFAGLKEATDKNMDDEVVRNQLGISYAYENEGEKQDAAKWAALAYKTAESIGLESEKNEASKLIHENQKAEGNIST